ncbi:MAG: hypothetical protein QM802_01635 [Agriterribacter sp.]
MKMIPLFRCSHIINAVAFYTGILDFTCDDADLSPDTDVVLLKNGDAALMLTRLEGDQKMRIAAYVIVENVDALFEKYIARGLDVSGKPDSPVHQAPFNQTWGTREWYVSDADGNTLRFVQSTP